MERKKMGTVFGKTFGNGSGEKMKPAKAAGIKKITKEFYAKGQDGSRMKNEAHKASELLTFIRERMAAYQKHFNKPMSKKEIDALGFDLAELEQGRIRPAKVE